MVLQYDDYKQYLKDWMLAQDSRGRGETNRMAKHLNISPSLVSTILNSDRHFSVEQAAELAGYLGIDNIEAEYLIALVSCEKAGSIKLKNFWALQKKKIQREATNIQSRLKVEKVLTGEDQARYYSHALYSQIRVLATLEGGIPRAELMDTLRYSPDQIQDAIDFLLGLDLIQGDETAYRATEQVVHVGRESNVYLAHHRNWRLKQMDQMTANKTDGITFTFPCTLSKADYKRIEDMLNEIIARTHKIVRESPAEMMACMTIDFIDYKRTRR